MLPQITRLFVSDEKIRVGSKCVMRGEGPHPTELCRRANEEGALNHLRDSASRCVLHSPS